MVLLDFLFFVFAIAERKNEKQLNDKVPLCRRLNMLANALPPWVGRSQS